MYDPFEDAILVCTGDRDREVAILKTRNGFQTLEPIVQGDQQYRTTSLIPTKESILYGTDNPDGDNYVMALNRQNGSVERVQELPGPVLYGCRVGEFAVFGTMVEKKDHEVTVWAGNERAFRLVAHFNTRKGTWLWREAAGYSTVMFCPEGTRPLASSFSWTPIGTQSLQTVCFESTLTNKGP